MLAQIRTPEAGDEPIAAYGDCDSPRLRGNVQTRHGMQAEGREPELHWSNQGLLEHSGSDAGAEKGLWDPFSRCPFLLLCQIPGRCAAKPGEVKEYFRASPCSHGREGADEWFMGSCTSEG